MPRKQNGFGKAQSFAFKGNDLPTRIGRVDRCGTYPSNRKFGSLITRSPIDKFNIDSTWQKWRKGYEYYTKQKFVSFPLPQFSAEIFPSFTNKLLVSFEATRFPTAESDDATHYVLERIVAPHAPFMECLGQLKELGGYSFKNTQYENNERWELVEFQGEANLLKLLNETITTKENESGYVKQDKTTNAIIKNILTVDQSIPEYITKDKVIPAVYVGNSNTQGTQLTIRAKEIFNYDGTAGQVFPSTDQDLQSFAGKQISIFDASPFYDISGGDLNFEEIDNETFKSSAILRGGFGSTDCKFFIYDAKPLSEDTGIVYQRDLAAIGIQANFGGGGDFIFNKSAYQRWFNTEFNAYLLRQLVQSIGPLIPTAMTIRSLGRVNGKGDDVQPDENIIIEVEPFTSQMLYAKRPFSVSGVSDNCYIMTNPKQSFTQELNTFDDRNNLLKTQVNINVNTEIDETFVAGERLWLANLFSCDCPSYSKARITAPESTYLDNRRSANRQRRYPLPTAGENRAKTAIDNAGDVAGIINTWTSDADREIFQCCKHTMSAYFSTNRAVIEPNEIPIYKDRVKIEEKIQNDIDDSISSDSIKRAELSSTGFVWALVQLMVQTTATIIASQESGARDALQPLEFFYGFQKVRKLVPEGERALREYELFDVLPENIIDA